MTKGYLFDYQHIDYYIEINHVIKNSYNYGIVYFIHKNVLNIIDLYVFICEIAKKQNHP